MKSRATAGTHAFITFIILLAVIGTKWSFISNRSRSQAMTLQAGFDRLQGYDEDPVIPVFRDHGQAGVAFLAQKLESQDGATQVKAVEALRQMGRAYTASDGGLAALCAALNEPGQVAEIAEGALGDIGPKARKAIPALIKRVSAGTDINGVWALGRIGPDAQAALPVLESKMRQATGRERVYAAGAVWAIGGENPEAKAVIEKTLADPDKHIQIDAKNVLVDNPEISSR